MKDNILGLVQNNQFKVLYPNSHSVPDIYIKLTKDSMAVGRPPIELDLTEYEGKAILVNGDNRGNWVYQVEIIEQAGPILTIITTQVFDIINNPQQG